MSNKYPLNKKANSIEKHAKEFESHYKGSVSTTCQFEKYLDNGIFFKDRNELMRKGFFKSKKKFLMQYYTIPYFDNVYPHITFKNNMNVLFIGVGTGMDIKDLFNYTQCALNIYGLDICFANVRICHKNKVPGTIIQAAAENLPFPDNTFDVIISCETIEHVYNPRKMVKEIARTAKSHCQVFIGTPNGSSLALCHIVECIYTLITGKRFIPRTITDNHYTPNEILSIIEDAEKIALSKKVFDMPFYFLCGALPERAYFIIPIIKRLTNFTQYVPYFNRIFCDQAKYFFGVQKAPNKNEIHKISFAFVCPECKGDLEFKDDSYICERCKFVYSTIDGVTQFLPGCDLDTNSEINSESKKHSKKENITKSLLLQGYNITLLILWVLLLPFMLPISFFMKRRDIYHQKND